MINRQLLSAVVISVKSTYFICCFSVYLTWRRTRRRLRARSEDYE